MPVSADLAADLAEVARIHESATHAPHLPEVSVSYGYLKRDLARQFEALRAEGVRVTFTNEDPYRTSEALRADLAQGILRVYTEADLPSDHPFAYPSPFGVSWNLVFRAVHDAYGHGRTGHGFGPLGELRAFQTHAEACHVASLSALAAETLAQNAWYNFGPHNPQKLAADLRPFADQKAYAFPVSVAVAFALKKKV